MSCLGTLLGATIGLFFGGPLGAIAGAAFGSWATSFKDTRSSENDREDGSPYSQNWNRRMNSQEHAQMTFFVGVFSILGKLAAVDGRVSPQERAKVEEFIDTELRPDPETRASALRIFDAAAVSGESFYQLTNQFYSKFRFQPQFFELLIDIMIRVAEVDSGINEKEETLIIDAVHIFRFSEERYRQLRARHGSGRGFSRSSAYAVLGCSPEDSEEALKKAYRRLVSEYHPDKIASKGLPEEFAKMAADKFREIQSAYEEIRKERGF
ncbi:MAG: TerB family tellurite resistance protein [Spirochaetales bacterium]|nr:TerB family tellurite resistance protein [Spirochaetales bacterium]